jgi:hypothetical protein
LTIAQLLIAGTRGDNETTGNRWGTSFGFARSAVLVIDAAAASEHIRDISMGFTGPESGNLPIK